MKNLKQEIECLARYNILSNGGMEEIVALLKDEKLIQPEQVRVLFAQADIPKALHSILRNLSSTGTLQLLEFEWQILPVERVKITVVTDKVSREFSYGY